MAKPSPSTITRIGDLLPRQEWDFSSCPPARLYFCYTYEFARECPEIIARFRHAQASDPTEFNNVGTWHHVVMGTLPRLRVDDPNDPKEDCDDDTVIEVIDAPKGFPDVPYLRTEHVVSVESHFPFLAGLEPLRSVLLQPNGSFEAEDDWYCPATVKPEQVVHFEIDWNATDESIRETFARWLADARKGRKDRQPVKKQGRSEVRHFRRRLKLLAMARLARHFVEHGLTIEVASEYAANLEDIPEKWQLYSEASDWSAAKGEVQKIVDEWIKR